ncbi:unnamed protein product [Caenorhabditis bovis]|uniref:VWFC domain-containing protein n=1 Tax=Caenorhabditis bovis TaxID=2654633 RepID=A0A8S1FFD5_9PELO|nr:unnamed protein product [Caenorhabditis bovis]
MGWPLLFNMAILVAVIASTPETLHRLSQSEQDHYWNMFKMRDVNLMAKIDMRSSGVLFRTQSPDEQLKMEILIHKRTISVQFPEYDGWHRRITFKVPKHLDGSHIFDFTLMINSNTLFIYDNCTEIFSDQIDEMDIRFEHPQMELIPEWNGHFPMNLSIGTGFPLRYKCHNISNLMPHYHTLRIENVGHPTSYKIHSYPVSQVFEAPDDFDGCNINEVYVKTGQTVSFDCYHCSCTANKTVACNVPKCPNLHCRNPVLREGDCCPSCGKKCYYKESHSYHPNGEIFWPDHCYRCVCDDGELSCETIKKPCQEPKCPKSDWIFESEHQCCPKCKNFADYCAIHPCSPNASCHSERRGPRCVCGSGYRGNGTVCQDIDECAFSEDAKAQLGGCLSGTECVNTPGSFRCKCLPGFQRVSNNICVPLLRI